MTISAALAGSYDYRLLALPASVSTVAAYVALDLAERFRSAQGRSRAMLLLGAAIAMGTGVWASRYNSGGDMHPLNQVLYHWPTVLLAFLASVLTSALAIWIASLPGSWTLRLLVAGAVMGGGIAARFYIGMAALRLQTVSAYSPGLTALSIAVPVAASMIALQLVWRTGSGAAAWNWTKLLSALLLGVAIAISSYLNIFAARIVPAPLPSAALAHAVSITALNFIGTAVATLIILSLVLVSSMVDRRLQRQAQMLAANEAQLTSIFENLTDGILVLDRDMKIVHINRAATRLANLPVGTTSLDLIRETVDSYSPEGEFLPPDKRPIARAFRGDYVHNYELTIRPKSSGRQSVTAVSTAPILNDAGETVQIIASFREITERKRVEAAHARLAAIVESSEDAIIGKDLRGVVTSWNRGAEKIFGYTADEMVGQPILCLLPADRESEEVEILARILRGETIELTETIRKRKDGQLIHVALSVSPIRDTGNRIIGASKVARNITEKKQLERQLHQSRKMEAVGQLTGGVAHDFNNLLGVIVGNLDLLERMLAGNESALKRVQTAQRAAARGADLTRRLLAFSSKEELSPTRISLEDSIRNTVALASRALGPEIKVSTRFDDSVPPVFVDQAGLESALLNLAVNARDAMPRGGTLTISTQLTNLEANYPPVLTGELKEGRYACVSVTDTGQGMSRETLERAFEPFFTTKPRGKGTGLGLAMVYGFVRQSGGTARIYSELGFGTTVSLYLPLAGAAQGAEPAAAPARLAAMRTGTVVVVVDDEPDLLELAVAYLSELGVEAVPAADGSSALEIFAQRRDIDLLLTDVIMPGGMNGVELAQKVRELSPRTRVIFSSGFPADALEEKDGRLVDWPLLRKPYQRVDFTAAIRSSMEADSAPAKGDDARYAEADL